MLFCSLACPLAALVGVPTAPAFANAVHAPRSRVTQMQAPQIPAIAYTGAAAAVAIRASRASAPAELAVLGATSLLALVDFGPTAAKQLNSANHAIKAAQTKPTPAAVSKEQAWLSAIMIKLMGQLSGLTWMALSRQGSGVLRGAALMMAGNMCFWIAGAGAARHDGEGKHAPVPDKLVRIIFTADALLFSALLTGAISPAQSTSRAACSAVFAVGAMAGVFENIAKFIKALPGSLIGNVPP